MPVSAAAAPVVQAGIGAGASLIGGLLGSHSQNKAMKASEDARREALAYERERDAKADAERADAKAYFRQQQQAWQANRAGILSRYGIHVPSGGQGGGSPVTLGAIANAPRMAGLGGPSPMAPQAPQSIATPSQDGGMGNWQDWSRYGAV